MPDGSAAPAPRRQEVALLIAMLVALLVLILFILLVNMDPPLPSGIDPKMSAKDFLDHRKEVLDYRKELVSLVLTAFGAWVGAGTAFFFGRENFRQAAESLVRMRDTAPADRLKHVRVKDVPPRDLPSDWLVTDATTLATVHANIQKNPKSYWFVPVVAADGSLVDVVHKEGMSQFAMDLVLGIATGCSSTASDR